MHREHLRAHNRRRAREPAQQHQRAQRRRGCIVITQLVNVQLCRSGRESLFTSIRQWNALLATGMGIEVVLILVIVYTPVGNLVFGTAPIGADAWLFMLPFTTAMVTGEEIRKWIVRTNSRLANKRVSLTAN